MQCRKCGFDNPEGMKFCGQCAAALNLTCSNCQAENPPNFKFCGQCASPLFTEEKATENRGPSKPKPGVGSGNTPGTDLPSATIIPLEQPSSKKPLVSENDAPSVSTIPGYYFPNSQAERHPSQPTRQADLDVVVNHGAERRQLTVLFCDLVGSSTLSEETDPEDLREIMRQYRNSCDEVVHKYKGYVAQYLGDGILVYFGYPTAHEDDASRAVQTGLELIRAIAKLNHRLQQEFNISISIRLGIHTGLVVVGEISDGDKRSMALGETPNIAARLQGLADPDTIVISSATYRLCQNYFECGSLGDHDLKGFSRPFTLYRVVKEHDHREDFTTGSKQTPLIGREQESALLLDRLDQAKQGVGQVVLLSGEAGIGKSRLAQFVRESVSDEPHVLVEIYGSPYYQNSYLHCAAQLIRRHLGLSGKSDQEKISALESLFKRYDVCAQDKVPLFADLLSIPLDGERYQELQFTPVQKKQKTLEVFLTLAMAISSKKPLIIIAEDLHWMDPTTMDLLGMFIDQVPTASIFLLMTYRMEYTPTWTPRSHMTQISVNRLTRDQTAHMIKWLANNKELPQELVQEITNKTDGTPLFVEELTKMVLESDLLIETDDSYQLVSPISSLAIPSSLQDSLMSRLDRLGPNKELAQLSATLGREFSYNLLKAVAKPAETLFENRLAHLVYSELLYQRGIPPEASYTFRHALVHELAYQSLLKKTRQQYHHHISKTLQERFPEIIEESPEIMAHHCTEAGDYKEALKYWLEAGKKSIKRSAITDAIVHLNKALSVLKQLPESVGTVEYELSIQASLGLAYMLSKGYAASEVEKAFARAYSLCKMIGETEATFPVLCGLWEYYVVRGQLNTAEELSKQLLQIAQRSSDPILDHEAHRAMGGTLFWQGKLKAAFEYLQRGKESAANHSVKRISTQIYSQDTEVAILSNLACVLWLLGKPDQALGSANQAIKLAEQLSHPFSIAYANTFCIFVHQLRGDDFAVKKQAEILLSISDTYEFAYWRTIGKMLRALAYMNLHQDSQYIIGFEEALQGYKNTGSGLALSYFQVLLAQSYCFAGRYSQAYDLIDASLVEVEGNKERFFEPELYRVKADIILTADRLETTAEEYMEKALHLAKEQKAKSLELRAATDLGRLWQSQGKYSQAYNLINDILSQFTEGFKCKDWLRAEMLLSTLKTEQRQQGRGELA
jgi:class 3 adenylate cyclase/predicted ATPase